MHITTKGQVTIPRTIRNKTGMLPNTEVEFTISDKNNVIIMKKKKRSSRGSDLIKKMRGRANTKMTTDEIMALTRT
jgi:AbrB family looped-hinge helix DNA binding protein